MRCGKGITIVRFLNKWVYLLKSYCRSLCGNQCNAQTWVIFENIVLVESVD